MFLKTNNLLAALIFISLTTLNLVEKGGSTLVPKVLPWLDQKNQGASLKKTRTFDSPVKTKSFGTFPWSAAVATINSLLVSF